jgi:hypothetical protein
MFYTDGMPNVTNKEIKRIASTLPPVAERCVSGYDIVDGRLVPNFYTVAVNHERRIRKAVAAYGTDGLLSYLAWIEKLQKKRRDDVANQEQEALRVEGEDPVREDTKEEKGS